MWEIKSNIFRKTYLKQNFSLFRLLRFAQSELNLCIKENKRLLYTCLALMNVCYMLDNHNYRLNLPFYHSTTYSSRVLVQLLEYNK